MYYYYAFKLAIESELPFPELLVAPDFVSFDSDFVRIKFGEISPFGLSSADSKNLFYQATQSQVWLTIELVGRFLISNGNEILIDPAPGIDQDSLRVYILGSCMGALLMQRDLLVLHGNAVKIGNHCVSFVGDSGAGKSTISGECFKRGYSILADDVCAINAEGNVLPSFPQIKLWHDSAKHLDIETTGLRKITPDYEKFAVPIKQQFHTDMRQLNAIYVLKSHDKDEFHFEALTGVQKLQPMLENTYRSYFLTGLKKEDSHLRHCMVLANRLSVVTVTRPTQGFKLKELVDLIEQDLLSRVPPANKLSPQSVATIA